MTTVIASADILPSAPTHAGGLPKLAPPAVLSSSFDSIADTPPVNIPIALEVPWNGTLPDAAALVCRTLTDDITATCCLLLNGEAQTRGWTLGDPGLGNASDVVGASSAAATGSAPASSAPAAASSLAARDTIVTAATPANITTRLTLCALPSTANTSAFEVCAREQGAYNTTAMCYDPKDKESGGVRVGVGMGVLGVLAMSVLAAF